MLSFVPFDSEVPTGSLLWLFFITALRISLTVIIISVVGALSLAGMNIPKAPCGFATAPQPTESFPLPQFPYQLLLAVQVMHLFQTLSPSHCHSKLQGEHLNQYFPTLIPENLFQAIAKL